MSNYRKETLKLRAIKENKIFNKKSFNSKIRKKFNLKNKILNNYFIKKLWGNYASKLKLKSIVINDPNLPQSFNNFKILFISDLHLDIKPNSLEFINKINIPDYDLLIFGGDFFDKPKLNENKTNDFKKIFKLLKTKHNFAVLGNHDSKEIIEFENDYDLKFLINENVSIIRKNEKINITGIDDITSFNTEYQTKCLKKNNEYNICVSHNPDFLEIAEKHNYNLQLSGHTHGGQILLPFKFVLYPQTKYRFALSGLWNYKKMKGITSTGFGCATHPLRNIDPEIILITLKK
jgi:predicted MPP superfamily phosphohydrolase